MSFAITQNNPDLQFTSVTLGLIQIITLIAALLLKSSPNTYSPQLTNVGEQCNLATNAITDKDIFLSQSIQNIVVYVIIIIFAILLYTAIVFLIGYKFGFQNAQRQVHIEKVTIEKSTMAPVTYTFVRGVKDPRFEHHPNLGGCWP